MKIKMFSCRSICHFFFIVWCLAWLASGAGSLLAGAEAEKPMTQTLSSMEVELYGHDYASQPVMQRVKRLEMTILQEKLTGPLPERVHFLTRTLHSRNSKNNETTDAPIVTYLEDKLFQRTFPQMPLPNRLTQLEVQVYGRAYEQYPIPLRLQKLTYAIPLLSNRGLRLSKADTLPPVSPTAEASGAAIIASSRQPAVPKPSRRLSSHMFLAVKTPIPDVKEPQAMLPANYLAGIRRTADARALRWTHLPIQVYIKNTTNNSLFTSVVKAALLDWEPAFPTRLTEQADEADIVISLGREDWSRTSEKILVHPVAVLRNNGHHRGTILISLYPGQALPPDMLQHLTSHTLGHAFGLWGHSVDSGDIMYPALSLEKNDFPSLWHSPQQDDDTAGEMGKRIPEKPSQQDINTLLQLYQQPAEDLSELTPPSLKNNEP